MTVHARREGHITIRTPAVVGGNIRAVRVAHVVDLRFDLFGGLAGSVSHGRASPDNSGGVSALDGLVVGSLYFRRRRSNCIRA